MSMNMISTRKSIVTANCELPDVDLKLIDDDLNEIDETYITSNVEAKQIRSSKTEQIHSVCCGLILLWVVFSIHKMSRKKFSDM